MQILSQDSLPMADPPSDSAAYHQRSPHGPPPPIPPRSTRPDYQPARVLSQEDGHDRSDGDDDVAADSNESSASTDSFTSEFAGMTLTDIIHRQDNDYTVTLSLPANGLPIRVSKARSSTRYDCQIRNSNTAAMNSDPPAAALPVQQMTSPTSRDVPQRGLSQTPRKKKERFYVVTSGRRTGVFEDWPYVSALTNGIRNCQQSFSSRDEAISHFHNARRMGLVKQTGLCPEELLTNAPRDLSCD